MSRYNALVRFKGWDWASREHQFFSGKHFYFSLGLIGIMATLVCLCLSWPDFYYGDITLSPIFGMIVITRTSVSILLGLILN